MDDLNPESIWRFRIKGFGPLMVTMDSHGGSTYDRIQGDAKSRRDGDPGEHRRLGVALSNRPRVAGRGCGHARPAVRLPARPKHFNLSLFFQPLLSKHHG